MQRFAGPYDGYVARSRHACVNRACGRILRIDALKMHQRIRLSFDHDGAAGDRIGIVTLVKRAVHVARPRKVRKVGVVDCARHARKTERGNAEHDPKHPQFNH